MTCETSSALAAANSSASATADSSTSGSLSTVAHAFPCGRAARFAHAESLVAQGLEEHPRLRGLARAVDSLEGDEEPGHPGDATKGSGGAGAPTRHLACAAACAPS